MAFYINGGSGTVPTVLLFVGMALSRVGLWSFDLAETQIIQEGSPNEEAGLISGFQYSLCNIFGKLNSNGSLAKPNTSIYGIFVRYARVCYDHYLVVT